MASKNNNPVIKEILRQGAKLPPEVRDRYIAAALETGKVESNFQNLPGGDADSQGWRQERASLYKDPTNLKASVARFYQEASQFDKGQPSYDLAADVQRPAAQYRGRYKQVHEQALQMLGQGGATPSSPTYSTQTTTTPAVNYGAQRLGLVQNFLSQGGIANPNAIPYLAQANQLQDVPASSTTKRVKVSGQTTGSYGSGISPHAKPGDPVVSSKQSEGGLHQTDGLSGYPAHDYFAPSGSHAVAPIAGTVVKLSGHDPAQGPTNGPHGPLGWSVYIQGSDGKNYFLTHLGSRNVKVGQKVKQGQVIGTVADYAKYGTPSHIHEGVNG